MADTAEVGVGTLHPSTSEAQLPITLQTGLEQDVTYEPHNTQYLHIHAMALPALRTPQGPGTLPTPSPSRTWLPPLPGRLPQAPAAPVALSEAAVKHTSGLLSWPSPVL